MQVVIDSSAILAVLLNEPEREALIRATISSISNHAGINSIGGREALIAGLRRRRLSHDDVVTAWNSSEEVSLRFVEVDISRALLTAARNGIYGYDAYVLEAAEARRVPLLTLIRLSRKQPSRQASRLLEDLKSENVHLFRGQTAHC